ncbi:hypothetical protein LTR20_009112 [Exophiala xenobiotica]|nr:hypothetical protein LTS06_011778 [Exophiala xenobiotica]KAK5259436.1 hypothetical protein LTR40_005996 [Exophiala xenobiotica]KAK5367788.1 hypothetical protein LTS13_007718 [Exophiala xenobiotica]KAK5397729.1 hypothetical protein LTR79_005244 [Exophiala xenobiotica]KAK5421175.1 hypothetical protein LTR90_002662 [Exophiala xenobiotica]
MAFGEIASIQPPEVSHGTQMVKVVVGRDREEFSIHSALLASSSPIFRRCISQLVGYESDDTEMEIDCGCWDGCYTIILHSEHPNVFKVFYDWLYSGRIPGNFTVHKVAGDDRYIDTVWLDTLKMGNRLEITSIADIASGKIQELFSARTRLVPSKQFIEILFSNWDSNLADLQQLIAGHVVYCLTKSVDRSAFQDLLGVQSYNFLSEVGVALLDQVSTGELKFGSQVDPVYKVEHPYHQLFGRRAEDTAPQASDIPSAPFGLRYVVSDEPSNGWQRNVDAGSDSNVHGDRDEALDANHVNLTNSEPKRQDPTAFSDLGVQYNDVGPPEPQGWENATCPPSRVGILPSSQTFGDMPGQGRMASPMDYHHSTSFTSSGPGAPTPATDWTSLERQPGGAWVTDQPLNGHWCNSMTCPHQAEISGRFDSLSLDHGTDPVLAHNAQHFQLPGQVRRYVSMQAPFAGAIPAAGQPSSMVPSTSARPPLPALQDPRLGQASTDWPPISADTTAPTWYNRHQTVKTPGPAVTSSVPIYQDKWSENESTIMPFLVDAAFAAERADTKKVNTWTATAVEHKQFGRDFKKEAPKKEAQGWGAPAGENKDHTHRCTQHVCGLDMGDDECGCEDNPGKLATGASGWHCAAASNNDASWDRNAKQPGAGVNQLKKKETTYVLAVAGALVMDAPSGITKIL